MTTYIDILGKLARLIEAGCASEKFGSIIEDTDDSYDAYCISENLWLEVYHGDSTIEIIVQRYDSETESAGEFIFDRFVTLSSINYCEIVNEILEAI